MHCKVTGKACTGIIHFAMQTPFKWHAKLQDTVENATFGSEIMAGCVSVNQILGSRAALMAMGVPIESHTWLLGDNQSVITQCTVHTSTLSKRHNALAYHRIRWCVAAGIVKFVKIAGKENAADALTKYLPYVDAYPLLKPILFWRGETLEPGELDHFLQGSALFQVAATIHGELTSHGSGLAHTQGECHNDSGDERSSCTLCHHGSGDERSSCTLCHQAVGY